MLSATIYITLCSTRNRTRRWLRRLREPRYFAGLLAGAAYFYFAVFARLRTAGAARRRRAAGLAAIPALSGAAPVVASLGLLMAAAACWLMPGPGRLLEFSQPEVAFLFPAPFPRRQLLLYRLVRSQVGLFFAALITSLAFAVPAGSGVGAVRSVGAMWLLLMTARVYFAGVVLARPHLRAASPRLRLLARLPLAVVVVAVALVGRALARAFAAQPASSPGDVLDRVMAASTGGFPRLVLWPFAVLTAPLFAASWTEYLIALAGAASVLAVAACWVLASHAVFQDGDMFPPQGGQPAQGRTIYRVRKTDWTLASEGRPETAFVWKSVMQALRVVDRRVVVRLVLVLVGLSAFVALTNRTRGLAGAAGLFAAIGAAYAMLLAPQVLRLDFRQDLQHLELLKTWPIRAAAVVRGEIMGPALMLTAATWVLIGLAAFLSTAAFSGARLDWRLSIAAAAAILAPAFIFGQYTIHNAVALTFPAWVPLGIQRPRGLDAMGQRLLTLGGTWLALALMALPGAVIGAVLWVVFFRRIGPWVMVPAAGVVAAAMALEILLTAEALGPVYERLDLTAVERPD